MSDEQWASFDRHLRQRNYHEHVVRDEDDLSRLQEYIIELIETFCEQ